MIIKTTERCTPLYQKGNYFVSFYPSDGMYRNWVLFYNREDSYGEILYQWSVNL